MGVYFKHCIKYVVKRNNGSEICIANISSTSTRLTSTRYYERNRDHYQRDHMQSFSNIITEDVDIELTETEQNLVHHVKNVYEDIASMMWYDVSFGYATTF